MHPRLPALSGGDATVPSTEWTADLTGRRSRVQLPLWLLPPVPENPRFIPRSSALVTFGSQRDPDRYSSGHPRGARIPMLRTCGYATTRSRRTHAEVVTTGSRIVIPDFTPTGVDAGLPGRPPPRVDPHLARSSCDGSVHARVCRNR